MNRSAIVLARVRGIPTRMKRRVKRTINYLRGFYISAFGEGELLKVIRRVPGAKIDPYFDPNSVKQYSPLNICIYCGETDLQKLEEEHILAYSLGGDATLPKASCRKCAEITRDIETYCGELFLDVRVIARTHSRRPGRTHLSVGDRSLIQPPYLPPKKSVGSEEHPGLLALPMFDPPGIVMGRQPSNDFTNVETFFRWVAEDADDRLRALTRKIPHAAFGVMIDLNMFARFIAKTAHCTAVARYGLARFRPLLLEVILKGENTSYFIGCASTRVPDAVGMKTWARGEIRK
jgi:hypothetical protein